jgi:catechol 2,3-dioxygenase-like lactoylglutathione lyase family enzyme
MTTSIDRPIPAPALSRVQQPATVQMLSHLAYVTEDTARTVDFYTHILGLELCMSVMHDRIPSTGDTFPYLHTFFRLGDGSTLAFFESPGLPTRSGPSHPAYQIFDHLALQVASPAEVHAWRDWLVQNGVEVLGPVDHKIILSIYFRDEINNLRLELTTPLVDDWNDRGDVAQQDLQEWIATKARAAAEGRDVRQALSELIAEREREVAAGKRPEQIVE